MKTHNRKHNINPIVLKINPITGSTVLTVFSDGKRRTAHEDNSLRTAYHSAYQEMCRERIRTLAVFIGSDRKPRKIEIEQVAAFACIELDPSLNYKAFRNE